MRHRVRLDNLHESISPVHLSPSRRNECCQPVTRSTLLGAILDNVSSQLQNFSNCCECLISLVIPTLTPYPSRRSNLLTALSPSSRKVSASTQFQAYCLALSLKPTPESTMRTAISIIANPGLCPLQPQLSHLCNTPLLPRRHLSTPRPSHVRQGLVH
jgi:hypothetical protein